MERGTILTPAPMPSINSSKDLTKRLSHQNRDERRGNNHDIDPVMCADKTKITDERDYNQQAIAAILDHIARYRLSTFAALSRLPQFDDESPRHLRRLLRDCRDAGLVTSATLHSGSRYWFLTTAGATRCGLDESRSGPLSEKAKLRAYALLLFCCLADKPRHRLTTNELSQQFSVLHRPGMPGTYYYDPTGKGSIGLARIDAGHHGRWDRVVQSVQDDISLHRKLPGFRQLIKAHRFEITVLTPSSWVLSLPAPEQGKTTGREPESPQTELTSYKRSLSIRWK